MIAQEAMAAADPQKARRATPFPEKVGAYQILLPIASGGMGVVYLARKRGAGGFEREVALKLTHVFLREQPEFAAQLVEEAKIASRIIHPNVVQVLDVEDDPYGVFLVMQYVEGDTLGAMMQAATAEGARVPTDIGLRVLCDALAGLHAAHELRDGTGGSAGVVHRDFTPQNILVGLDGVSRLTDFGVAKAATRAGGATRTGVVKGKTAYMAPEQVRAQPLDRRCDVWSAGVVAWELFAGRRMHEPGTDPSALLLRIATEPPPRLRSIRPDIPREVDEAVAWALAHTRERRCPTAEQFRTRLLSACGGASAAAEPSAVGRYVERIAGAKLEERRARALAASRDATTGGGTRGEGDGPQGQVQATRSAAPAVEESLVSAAVPRPPAPPSRRRWLLAVEASVVGAAIVVLVAGVRRASLPAASSSAAAGTPSSMAPTATPAPAPPPDTATAAPIPPQTAEPPVLELPESTESKPAPPSASPPSRRSARPRKASGAPDASEPPLAKSPYE